MPLPPLLPRLSSTTRVAAHAMIEIAEADGHVVAAATIVRNQQVPGHFLDQLLGKLRRAGLLRSVRGPHGGYALTRSATSISLADIVDAVDVNPNPPAFRDVHARGSATPQTGCAVEQAWQSASAAMHDVMQHTSLAALVASKRELERQRAAQSAPRVLAYSG